MAHFPGSRTFLEPNITSSYRNIMWAGNFFMLKTYGDENMWNNPGCIQNVYHSRSTLPAPGCHLEPGPVPAMKHITDSAPTPCLPTLRNLIFYSQSFNFKFIPGSYREESKLEWIRVQRALLSEWVLKKDTVLRGNHKKILVFLRCAVREPVQQKRVCGKKMKATALRHTDWEECTWALGFTAVQRRGWPSSALDPWVGIGTPRSN